MQVGAVISILKGILEQLVFTYLSCGVKELQVDWTVWDLLAEIK